MLMEKFVDLGKRLPIIAPPIIGFLHHAYDLEILMTKKAYLPVFYMNFIDLNFIKNDFMNRDCHFLDFCGINIDEFIETYSFTQNVCKNESNLCKQILHYIDSGWYVQVIVDEFYIPDRVCYEKYHFPHMLQIYGYEGNAFWASGFRANRSYGNHMLIFEDFKKAVILQNGYIIRRIRNIRNESIELDISIIKEKLLEYLNAENLAVKYPRYPVRNGGAGEGLEFYWGLDIYEGFFEYLDLLSKDQVHFDIRPWHILWEHKKCMLNRLTYLIEEGYENMQEQRIAYLEVEKLTQIVRNKMLKFSISNDKKLIADSNKILVNIRDMEMKRIYEIVKNL